VDELVEGAQLGLGEAVLEAGRRSSVGTSAVTSSACWRLSGQSVSSKGKWLAHIRWALPSLRRFFTAERSWWNVNHECRRMYSLGRASASASAYSDR
jgi:hypothetical protein